MYSTALGVNEDLKNLSYYDNIMNKVSRLQTLLVSQSLISRPRQQPTNNIPIVFCQDRDRIGLRFEEAAAHSIEACEGKLSNDMMKRHLMDHGPLVVLVDCGLLVCDLCKHNKMKYEFSLLSTVEAAQGFHCCKLGY
ncbi:guanylylate cyclase domain-containing protein [Phthorimaea operculella]|nr:guanylylate cyclase domain-containing protein [Phthorimaea operculella]